MNAGARLYAALLGFVALTGVAACASAAGVRVLRTPVADVRPATHVATIREYDVAVATITDVLQREFGVSPYPVDFHFYPDRRAFQDGLLSVGYSDALARDTARTMDAVGGYRRVMLNEAALLRQTWPVRVASLAHEMTHSLQYELGGRTRGMSDQWLREGFAEWLAMRVLHRLRGISFTDVRRRYLNTVRRTPRSNVPALADMVTFPQWVQVNSRRGVVAYQQAFVAVDFLIERHGVPAVFHYFKLFSASQDRASNFLAAFDERPDAFEKALRDFIW